VQSHERIPCAEVYRAGDGVHATWLEQRARVLPGWRAWAMRNNPYHRYLLHTERALFESPGLRAVICNANMVRDDILSRFAIDEARIEVIYNGVDTCRFHPRLRHRRNALRVTLGLPGAPPLLLFVGSGFERKGLAAAVAAQTGRSRPCSLPWPPAGDRAGLWRRRRPHSAHPLRPLPQRHSGGHGLWIAGHREPPGRYA